MLRPLPPMVRFGMEFLCTWDKYKISFFGKYQVFLGKKCSLASQVFFFFSFLKDLFYFYWKGRYSERRDREKDLPPMIHFPTDRNDWS